MVQICAKSIKPFRIYCEMKYLTFDFDIWLWGQGHKILFFYLALYVYYMVQVWAKSIKPFRIHRKMKYLTFDFDLWPWSQGHKKNVSYFIYLHLWSNYEQNQFSHLRENRIIQHQKEEQQQQQLLLSYDCSPYIVIY